MIAVTIAMPFWAFALITVACWAFLIVCVFGLCRCAGDADRRIESFTTGRR